MSTVLVLERQRLDSNTALGLRHSLQHNRLELRGKPLTSPPLPARTNTAQKSPFNNQTYGPGSGDIFFSAYFQTYVCIFQGAGTYSHFFLSYSTSGLLTGPWTTPELLFDTEVDDLCKVYSPNYELNYAGHAYPMWDVSGRTVLVSWSSCSAFTKMASVGFV